MRIRQVALVAADLEPALATLCDVLGIEVCYRDPGVATFGLVNGVMAVGDTFLEVVSPAKPGTSAGRLLERRGGDGGYMVILQTADLEEERRRVKELRVRVAWEARLDDAATLHLHPRDVGAAILSFDWMRGWADWRWAGPDWESKVRRDRTTRITAAELQAPDPAALASRWSAVVARPARETGDGEHTIELDSGRLRFVPDRDGRGEGLGGVEVSVADRVGLERRARARGLSIAGDVVEICGTRFRLVQAPGTRARAPLAAGADRCAAPH